MRKSYVYIMGTVYVVSKCALRIEIVKRKEIITLEAIKVCLVRYEGGNKSGLLQIC